MFQKDRPAAGQNVIPMWLSYGCFFFFGGGGGGGGGGVFGGGWYALFEGHVFIFTVVVVLPFQGSLEKIFDIWGGGFHRTTFSSPTLCVRDMTVSW